MLEVWKRFDFTPHEQWSSISMWVSDRWWHNYLIPSAPTTASDGSFLAFVYKYMFEF